jgi:DNA-directed RNA polymerase subunit M/transcription elongation factor TFIIS
MHSACPKCKAMMSSPVGELSAIQRMSCGFCGYKTFYHVHHVTDEEHAATAEESKWVKVFIVWETGHPTAAELVGLRQVVTAWRDKALSEVRDMLGNPVRHCLGEFELWRAKEMKEKGQTVGVTIKWSEVE